MTTMSFDEFFGSAPQPAGQSPEYDQEKMGNIAQIQDSIKFYQGKPGADVRIPILQKELASEQGQLNAPQETKDSIMQERAAYQRASAPSGGGAKTMSFDEFFGGQPKSVGGVKHGEPLPSWSPEENLKQTISETGARITAAVKALPMGMAQTGATLADMVLGSPGMLWKSGIVYPYARALGASPEQATALSEHVTPDGLLAPVTSAINALGLGDGSDEQAVNKAMDFLTKGIKKGSQWLSDKTDGAIPPEDFENVASAMMGIAGVKGGQAITSKIIANAEKARQLGVEQRDVQRAPGPDQRVEPTMGGPDESGAATPSEEPTPQGPDRMAAMEANAGETQTAPQGARPFEANALWRSPEGDRPVEILQRDFEQTPEGRSFTKVRDEAGTEAVIPSDQLAGAGKPKVIPRKPSGAIDTDLLNTMGGASAAIAAGGWLYMNPDEAEKLIGGAAGLAALGAIKGKGGMWHPEAVTRLSKPLKDTLLRGRGFEPVEDQTGLAAQEAGQKAVGDWSDKTIRNYLNRHAGTATDPLKDVRIPMLGDDVRWEDVWDQVIQPKKVVVFKAGFAYPTNLENIKNFPGAKSGETVYSLANDRWRPEGEDISDRLHALNNYLSHVGDYLREFVPPEKLGQYDLVRAVQETAKQDERQAAKMAKARVNQAGTVDYKTYPDGMRWVEVGVPGKEMAPGYSVFQEGQNRWRVDIPKDGKTYIGDGDSIDQHANIFPTKEAAEKAAIQHAADNALKNEGDVMGHCVGGYCEMVHSGESRIFSLRDQKGISHVTVEVSPPDPRAQGTTPRDFANMVGGDLLRRYNEAYKTADMSVERSIVQSPEYQAWMKDKPSDIVQIKGKQNRAPVEKYLPYVQDFVKSGKWGGVGDLQNTGLFDRKTAFYSLEDAINGHNEWSLEHKNQVKQFAKNELSKLDQQFYSVDDLEKIHRGIEDFGRIPGQEGKIDPRLLKGLAVAGTGALIGAKLNPDDKAVGAALGALAALGIAKGAKNISGVKLVEKGLKISLNQALRRLNPDAISPEFEKSSAVLASHYVKQIQAEVEQGTKGAPRKAFFDKMAPEGRMSFIKGLEIPGVKYKDAALQKMHEYYRQWMKNIYEQDKAKGIEYEPEENYVYHVFKDPEAVTQYFEKKYGTQWGDPRFTKDRKINTIKEAQEAGFELKYDNPEQIAQARQTASDIAAMKIDALREMTEAGLGRPVKKGMVAGAEETTWRAPNGELYFMGDAANQILHNAFNSKSLWGDPGMLGMTYRGAMHLKNGILPVKLLSGFHLLHVALGMITGTKAVNAIKGVAGGDIGLGRALWDVGKSVTLIDAGASLRYGYRKMQPRSMRAFRGEIPAEQLTDLDKTQMLRAIEGGFSPEMSPEYRNQHIQAWKDAVTRVGAGQRVVGSTARAIWETPFAALQLVFTRPMFENWIPAVKWQAFQQSAAAALAADPTLAGNTLARKVALRKISKMIDDRFGEMNYKTNFMDRLTKDVGVASLLSYGWQAGFVRSYLGALPESWRVFTEGDQPLRQKIAQGKLDKTLFLSSYLTQTMLYGGLMTYAMTGTMPQKILDYIFPRTGETNKDGSPARVSTPFYTREFASVPYHMQKDGVVGGLATTIGNKINPAYGMVKGILFNKDYFDRAISDPHDPLVQQVKDRAGWGLHEIAPMAVTAPERGTGSTKEKVLSAAGFAPAPKYATLPEADPKLLKEVRGEQRRLAEERKRAKNPNYDTEKRLKRMGITP